MVQNRIHYSQCNNSVIGNQRTKSESFAPLSYSFLLDSVKQNSTRHDLAEQRQKTIYKLRELVRYPRTGRKRRYIVRLFRESLRERAQRQARVRLGVTEDGIEGTSVGVAEADEEEPGRVNSTPTNYLQFRVNSSFLRQHNTCIRTASSGS